MEYSFESYQIAEMAVEIEKESFKFYQRLANFLTEQAVKELFLSLAQDERIHEGTFAGIARDAKNAKEVYGYSINIAEMMKIGINKLKEAMVNSTPVDTQIDMHRALEVAINSEVLAVQVYTEVAHAYSKRFSNVFEKIIIQENSHLKRLQDLKQKLGI
jgi:rubrerythrin